MGLVVADLGGKGLTMERHAIGIDLGGTSVKYAVVAASGRILHHGEHPSRAAEGADAVVEQIVRGIDACRTWAAASGVELSGVGIGTPGVVSDDGRTVLGGAENIAGWENVPLASRIEAATGLRTVAGNDAQTPESPATADSRKDIGMITINPRITEMICAGSGLSVEVKYTESMIFSPANTQPVKKILSPASAIS